jgi:hypothetical protein
MAVANYRHETAFRSRSQTEMVNRPKWLESRLSNYIVSSIRCNKKEVKKNEMILNQFLAGPAAIVQTLKLHTSFSRVTILQARVEIKKFNRSGDGAGVFSRKYGGRGPA